MREPNFLGSIDQNRVSRFQSRRGGVMKSAFFLGLFLAASLTLVWMLALPWGFGVKLERDTGCSLQTERLFCNPFGFDVHFENASLGNAERFGEKRPY